MYFSSSIEGLILTKKSNQYLVTVTIIHKVDPFIKNQILLDYL